MLTALLLILAATLMGAGWLAHRLGVVYVGRTMGGWTSVHDDWNVMGERIRVLDVAGTYQSATYLDERWCDPVYPYHRLFDHLFDAWPEQDGPRRVAILGGGGYTLPRHLVAHHPEVRRIDVVELDSAIERVARRFFFLDRLERNTGAIQSGRLALHIGDAAGWLSQSSDAYDVILNDCFVADRPEAALMTVSGARTVHRHLTDGGLYLTNIVSALEGPDARTLYAALSAFGQVFAHIWVYPCGEEDPEGRENNVVIASDTAYQFAGAWEWPTSQQRRSTSDANE